MKKNGSKLTIIHDTLPKMIYLPVCHFGFLTHLVQKKTSVRDLYINHCDYQKLAKDCPT